MPFRRRRGDPRAVELRANPWRVGITHGQFVLRDLTPGRPVADDCDPWTEDALAANVGELPGELYIATGDTITVDVELEVHESRPDRDVSACVYATEASLDDPSGRVSVDELMTDAIGRRPVEVAPGPYRVLVSHLEETLDDDTADRMALDIWPAPVEPVRVLKPG